MPNFWHRPIPTWVFFAGMGLLFTAWFAYTYSAVHEWPVPWQRVEAARARRMVTTSRMNHPDTFEDNRRRFLEKGGTSYQWEEKTRYVKRIPAGDQDMRWNAGMAVMNFLMAAFYYFMDRGRRRPSTESHRQEN